MSFDAGGLAQMTYNSNNGFSSGGLGAPGSGFGNRSRLNSKRLSVALPPKVNPISEDQIDNPTPRTSRSHLLAGLRTQPKTSSGSASAPYNQTQHQLQGLGASKWANQGYGYEQGMPQTAIGTSYDVANQYAMHAGRQYYSLPEQVLAPPSLYDEADEMDPAVLQQMQMTSLYLAHRQQQLQQQLANLTASAQGLNLNTNLGRNPYQQSPMTPQTPQSLYGQQQVQSPIEVPGQPGVYLVYNPAIQGYSYVVDPALQQQTSMSPVHQHQQSGSFSSPQSFQPPTPTVSVTPPANDTPNPMTFRTYSPPKKSSSPPSALENVEPLPPPSSNAFRRGHNRGKSSLTINPTNDNVANGPKTTSATTFGSQRSVIPAPPMTGTFGPGAARAGEHPIRQPRGPPPLEELTTLPTSKHEGSKNFATRQRRRALDSLMRAGTSRRGLSRSSSGSPVSEGDYNFFSEGAEDDVVSVGSNGSRKMSPIGSEMKEKRGSQGSDTGYFGLSSASSSEGEDAGVFKQPPTPATPVAATGGDRKMMMLGVLNAAEKRRSVVS